MRILIIILTAMSVISCSQPSSKSDLETKQEITKLMIEFQDYLNNYGLTQAFMLATEEPYFELYDESFFLKAVQEGRIDENTVLLDYAVENILKSDLLSGSYKERIKLNSENGLDFSIWKNDATIGSVLTDSEFGMDFKGPLINDIYTTDKEIFELALIDQERHKNGFSPNPDSILISYEISPKEVYLHFIEITSSTTASYYINSKAIRKAGKSPRFIMDFIYIEGKGWLIDNMYFDDYNGKILKVYADYNEY